MAISKGYYTLNECRDKWTTLESLSFFTHRSVCAGFVSVETKLGKDQQGKWKIRHKEKKLKYKHLEV